MSMMSLADSRHLGASSNSLTSVMTKSGKSSPTLSRKLSVRSTTADKVFENEFKGKMKKASSRTSLTSVLESKLSFFFGLNTGCPTKRVSTFDGLLEPEKWYSNYYF